MIRYDKEKDKTITKDTLLDYLSFATYKVCTQEQCVEKLVENLFCLYR